MNFNFVHAMTVKRFFVVATLVGSLLSCHSFADEAVPLFGRLNIAGRTGFVTLDDDKSTQLEVAVESPSKSKPFAVTVWLLLKDGTAETPMAVLPAPGEPPPTVGNATTTTSYFIYSFAKTDSKQRTAVVVGIDNQFQLFPLGLVQGKLARNQ